MTQFKDLEVKTTFGVNTALYSKVAGTEFDTSDNNPICRLLIEYLNDRKPSELKKKPYTYALDKHQRSILHYFALLGDSNNLTTILNLGNATPHALDQDNNTIFHYLACAANLTKQDLNNILTVNFLDPFAKNLKGLTPLDHIILSDHAALTDVAAYLIRVAPSANLLYHALNANGLCKITKVFLDNNNTSPLAFYDRLAALHYREPNSQQTPLHLVVRKGDAIATTKLLESGANINAQDINGNTPLHLATEKGNSQRSLIKLLLKNKANLTLKNKKKYTPAQWAYHYKQYTTANIINYKQAQHELKYPIKPWTTNDSMWLELIQDKNKAEIIWRKMLLHTVIMEIKSYNDWKWYHYNFWVTPNYQDSVKKLTSSLTFLQCEAKKDNPMPAQYDENYAIDSAQFKNGEAPWSIIIATLKYYINTTLKPAIIDQGYTPKATLISLMRHIIWRCNQCQPAHPYTLALRGNMAPQDDNIAAQPAVPVAPN